MFTTELSGDIRLVSQISDDHRREVEVVMNKCLLQSCIAVPCSGTRIFRHNAS